MEKDTTLYRFNQIIHYAVYAVTGLLLLRFVMKLLGANPAAAFTDIIYSLSGIFVAPFMYVFGLVELGAGALEWNTLLAIFVYWLLGEGFIMMVAGFRSVDSREARQELREDYQ